MTNENIVGEVVFSDVIWKDIPWFSNYQASSEGRIRRKGDDKILEMTGDRTDKKSYPTTSAIGDNRKTKTAFVHVLVCLAFHGLPPDESTLYDVNHKDGNKWNSRPSNLEWMTRSENLIHAYETGLRNDCCRVTVKDIINGEEKQFYSLNNFGSHFNLTISEVKKLRFTKPKLFKEIYEVVFHIDKYIAPKHVWIKPIMAKNYSDGEILIANNNLEMSEIVNIHPGTIQFCASQEKDSMTNGYVFRYLTDNVIWPVYASEDVIKSKEKWERKKKEYRKKRSGIEIKDYITGEVSSFDKLEEGESVSGLSKTLIQRMLFSDNLQLYRGKSVRYKDDIRSFPDFNKELIRISLDFKPGKIAPVQVEDLLSNTTKLYASIAEFAREKNLNSVSVANWVRLNPNKPLQNIFVIKPYLF